MTGFTNVGFASVGLLGVRARPVAALLALLGAMAAAAAPVAAAGATPSAPPAAGRSGEPFDPLSLLEGSAAGWSASRSDAGCYLLSPYRKDASRLAIGRHPTLGLGLFAVSFPLATKIDAVEPMMVHVHGRDLDVDGRTVVANLMFVALGAAAIEAELAELQDAGALWLEVRRTWIMHDGHGAGDAIAAYRSMCAVAGPTSPGANANGP